MQVSEFETYDLEHSRSVVHVLKLFDFDDEGGSLKIDLKEKSNLPENMFHLLNSLRRVGITKNLDLILYKNTKKSGHFFTESSSGETQLLLTFTSLIVNINNNSIVFIDEPELSLHPNWQIRYFSLLDKVLRKTKNCHVILATHSHFMVSDLNPEDSHLICLKSNFPIDTISSQDIPSSTYGGSPESILYNIFNVRTVSSIYLERDLKKALELIAENSKDKNEIGRLREKFESLVLDDEDPIYSIISALQDYEKNYV